jgi:hypothetical protein
MIVLELLGVCLLAGVIVIGLYNATKAAVVRWWSE